MITIEQLKLEIEGLGTKNLEVLYPIIQLLQSKTTNPKDDYINPLKGSVTFEKDIISPIHESWEVDL